MTFLRRSSMARREIDGSMPVAVAILIPVAAPPAILAFLLGVLLAFPFLLFVPFLLFSPLLSLPHSILPPHHPIHPPPSLPPPTLPPLLACAGPRRGQQPTATHSGVLGGLPGLSVPPAPTSPLVHTTLTIKYQLTINVICQAHHHTRHARVAVDELGRGKGWHHRMQVVELLLLRRVSNRRLHTQACACMAHWHLAANQSAIYFPCTLVRCSLQLHRAACGGAGGVPVDPYAAFFGDGYDDVVSLQWWPPLLQTYATYGLRPSCLIASTDTAQCCTPPHRTSRTSISTVQYRAL